MHQDTAISPSQLSAVLAELVSALTNTLNDERASAEECLSRIVAILNPPGIPRMPASERMPGGLAPWQIRKVTSHIEANLDGAIRSGDLAAILNLTPCHFSRAFRASFGEPPLEYVIRRRMERAQGLMLSTDAPLSQIALDCGLADQAHFSRLFRRTVGESPNAWRRARVNSGSHHASAGSASCAEPRRPDNFKLPVASAGSNHERIGNVFHS